MSWVNYIHGKNNTGEHGIILVVSERENRAELNMWTKKKSL